MKRTNELLLLLRQLVNDAIAWKALDALDGAENQKDGMEISEARERSFAPSTVGVQIDSTHANLTQLEVSEKLVQCVRSVVGVPQAYLMLLGAYVSRPCRQPQNKVT